MILDDQVVLNHPFADCVSLARSLKVKNDRNNTLISKTIPFSWMNSTYVAVCRQLLQGCILSIKIPRAKQPVGKTTWPPSFQIFQKLGGLEYRLE